MGNPNMYLTDRFTSHFIIGSNLLIIITTTMMTLVIYVIPVLQKFLSYVKTLETVRLCQNSFSDPNTTTNLKLI